MVLEYHRSARVKSEHNSKISVRELYSNEILNPLQMDWKKDGGVCEGEASFENRRSSTNKSKDDTIKQELVEII